MRLLKIFMIFLSQFANLEPLFSQTIKGLTVENKTPVITGEQFAVIVGISHYKNIPSLQFADADARFFADFLIKNLGVKRDNVRLFLNDTATLSILYELNSLKKKVKAGDRVYIYFSGHGDIETEMQQGGLLLLYESNVENYYLNPNGYIQESQLKASIAQLTALNAEVIFIADACHSGKLSGGDDGRKNNLLALKQEWGNEVKIFSCQPDQVSLEGVQWGKGRGLFSWHLINGLKGAADTTDSPGEYPDKKVTLLELQNFLQSNVRKEAKPNKQTPFVIGNPEVIICNVTQTSTDEKDKFLLAEFSDGGKKGKLTSNLNNEQADAYAKFNESIKKGVLSFSSNSANEYLNLMRKVNVPDDILEDATRSLVSGLLKKSTTIINPLLSGTEIITSKSVIDNTIAEMEIAMNLLGTDHYLWPAFQARKLFLKSVGITLTEVDAAKKENVNQAIQWLEQSVLLEPYAYYSYFQLGVCYYRKKLPEKAIEYFDRYKSYLPKDADTYNNIGLAYFKLGNLKDAVGYIAKALRIDSTNYVYYYNMGNVMCNAGDFPQGVRAYRKALHHEPEQSDVMFNMANAFSYAGLNDSALYYYRTILKKDNTDNKTWQYMGNTLKKMKKYDEALVSYSNALKNGNTAYRIYYNMASIFSIIGDKERSLSFFEESLKTGMNDFVLEIYKNAELVNLRSTPRFSVLMKKYASK